VAKDIGNDNNLSDEEHPSIKIIKENKKEIAKLIFHEIENDFVSKQINKANSKKQQDVMAFRKDETLCQRRSQSAHILLFHKIWK
jgi:hypothetical protein